MPIVAVASYVVQLLLIIHVVRTGRPYYWIYILMFAPGLGALAYIVAEILPELMGTRSARQAAVKAQDIVNPERHYRVLVDRFETIDTPENRRLLAEECLKLRKYDQAATLFEGALTGVHMDDTALLMGLARAHAGREEHAKCLETLDRLKAASPNFQSADGQLLYAQSLDGLGRLDEALREYEALTRYFPGEEARCRYGLALQKAGRMEAARQLFRDIVRNVDKGPRHYRPMQREWYDIAKRNLA